MYGEGRIAGVIEIFKRGFSFCERTGAFSLIKTKELLVAEGAIHAVRLKQKSKTKRKKKITAVIYEYQADCDGEWGEISVDLRTAQQKSFGLLIGIQLKRTGLPMR